MGNLFKLSWWIQMFVSTFMTMCFIYLIKKVTAKVNIPVVSDIAAEA